MEDMTPTLRLILDLRESLERGESIRYSLSNFADKETSDLRFEILRLLQGNERATPLRKLKETEKTLFNVIRRGLHGEAIAGILRELETDLVERSQAEIEEFTQKLGLRCLLPLLLLVFPGYLVLLVGPLLVSLLRAFH